MIKYLKHNYEEIVKVSLLLSLIGILVYAFPILIEGNQYYKGISNLTSLNYYVVAISILIPIYNFSVLKTKKGADFYYSLPVDKKTLNFQFYIKGLIEIILAFVFVYIIGFISVLIKGFDFKLLNYLPLLLIYIIIIAFYYSFNCFLFSKANTTIDGVAFILLQTILFYLFWGFLSEIFYNNIENINMFTNTASKFPFYPIFYVSDIFTARIEMFALNSYILDNLLSALFWIIISGLFLYLLFFQTKNQRPEEVSEVSNSWFGYKLFIPLLSFFLLFTLLAGNFIIYSIIISVIFMFLNIVSYSLYQRKLKISLKYIITSFAVPILAVLIKAIIYFWL